MGKFWRLQPYTLKCFPSSHHIPHILVCAPEGSGRVGEGGRELHLGSLGYGKNCLGCRARGAQSKRTMPLCKHGHLKPPGCFHSGRAPIPEGQGNSQPVFHGSRLPAAVWGWHPHHQYAALSLPYPCTVYAEPSMPSLHFLCPGFIEDLPPGVSNVVEDTCSDDESWQILLVKLKACPESLQAHIEVAQSVLPCHVAPHLLRQ